MTVGVSGTNAQTRLVVRVSQSGVVNPPAPAVFTVNDGDAGDCNPGAGEVAFMLNFTSPNGWRVNGIVDARNFFFLATHMAVVVFTSVPPAVPPPAIPCPVTAGVVDNISGVRMQGVVVLEASYFYPDDPIAFPNYAAAHLDGFFTGPPPGPVAASVELTCGEPTITFPDTVTCTAGLASVGVGEPGVGAFPIGSPFAGDSGWVRVLPDHNVSAHCLRLESSVTSIGAQLIFPGSAEVTISDDPPPPTGACCINGLCTVTHEYQCSASGGSYQGDGVSCGSGVCGCTSATDARSVAIGSGLEICNLTVTSTTDLVASTRSRTSRSRRLWNGGTPGLTVFGSIR
jgi:hypothetical protein